MKKLLFTLTALLLLTLPAGAQDENNKGKTCPWQYHGQNMRQQGDHRPAFSPWEYMKAENEFVTCHAQLTVVEANYVCPLLHEMKDKLRKTDFEIHRILKQASEGNLSDSDSRDTLNKIHDLQAKKQSIEKEYHKKMLKQISANKLLRVMRADMKFDRFMLRKMFGRFQTNTKEK